MIKSPAAMWWGFFFLRVSAVQSFAIRTSLGVSRPLAMGWHRQNLRSTVGSSKLQSSKTLSLDNTTQAILDRDNSVTSSTANEAGTVVLADAEEFIKPDRDLRDYRVVRLSNNLKVLLVSTANVSNEENTANVEAASMHIQAGHFDDPIPGLAHFYEHMLVRSFLF